MLNWWIRYWFSPAPLFNLGVCRIAIVGFQLTNLSLITPHALFSRLTQHPDALYNPPIFFRILTLPFGWHFRPSFEILEIIFWATLVAGFLALIGLKTNISLMSFALGYFFIHSFMYSFGEIHHPDALMVLVNFALAVSPVGQSLSIDDFWRRIRQARKEKRFTLFNILEEKSYLAKWSLLLIQWLLVLSYTSSFISKITRGGFEWANGFTLQYVLIQDGLRWNSDLALWLGQHHTLCWLLQWATLFFQGTFFLVMFIPMAAWIYLPIGITFHTVIYVTMTAPFFEWVTLYVAFIPWERFIRWVSQNKMMIKFIGSRELSFRPEVLFDGQCPLCIRSMIRLKYFDWFDRLAFSDVTQRWSSLAITYPDRTLADYLQEMYVILPNGTEYKGYFAFREILKYVPPLWPLRTLFYLPFASTLGPKIYKFVAARRQRSLRCTVDSCVIEANSAPKN